MAVPYYKFKINLPQNIPTKPRRCKWYGVCWLPFFIQYF